MSPGEESEWKTRKRRIDPRLDAIGWKLGQGAASPTPNRTEEHETQNGPADYVLWHERNIVGVVEAKKVTIGPQNVLTQAERYARGLGDTPFNLGGLRAPFLYSTSGEVTWFHDVRHPLNRSRRLAQFHTPNALAEMLGRDFDAECQRLAAIPHDHPRLRPYQREANAAVDKAIAERKRNLLVAMATGTGKTFTAVNQIYRLMKSGVARRVLFLVDRRALAAQTVRAFSSFEVEPGKKFDQVYEVYSSRFQTEDFGDEERFDPKVLPQGYLTDPKPGHAFVYVCTIQRMAINLLGRQAIFGLGDEHIEDDAERLDIPIHAFDAIIADEVHRGYTAQEVSTWRATLEHFDSIKIGLTATPASHTTAYFTHKVFTYSYEQAVREMPDLPDSWAYWRADEVVDPDTVVTYGIVLPGPEHPGGVPYVRQQDIVDGGILVNELRHTTPAIAAKHARSTLRAGDVLLCIIRNLRVAMVPKGLDGANITQGAVRLRPGQHVRGDYLAAYLACPAAQAWMKARYFGMDMPRINVEDARAIPIALPPIDEQAEIMRRVDALFRLEEKVRGRVAASINRAGALPQAILSKAFAGELVPTEADLARAENRDYETAEHALDRLRREVEGGVSRRPANKARGTRTD